MKKPKIKEYYKEWGKEYREANKEKEKERKKKRNRSFPSCAPFLRAHFFFLAQEEKEWKDRGKPEEQKERKNKRQRTGKGNLFFFSSFLRKKKRYGARALVDDVERVNCVKNVVYYPGYRVPVARYREYLKV